MKRLRWFIVIVLIFALFLAFKSARTRTSRHFLDEAGAGDRKAIGRAALLAPRTFRAQYEVGDVALELQEWRLAVSAYTRARQLGMGDVDLHRKRSRARYNSGDALGALIDMIFVTHNRPSEARAWASEAVLRVDLELYDSALLSVNRALALEPGNASYLALRGEIESQLGLHLEALSDMESAFAANGQDDVIGFDTVTDPGTYRYVTHDMLAEEAFRAGDFKRAGGLILDRINAWKAGRPYTSFSGYPNDLILYAECLRRLGSTAEALGKVDEVIQSMVPLYDIADRERYSLAPPGNPPRPEGEPGSTTGLEVSLGRNDIAYLLTSAYMERSLLLLSLGRPVEARAELDNVNRYFPGGIDVERTWRALQAGNEEPEFMDPGTLCVPWAASPPPMSAPSTVPSTY